MNLKWKGHLYLIRSGEGFPTGRRFAAERALLDARPDDNYYDGVLAAELGDRGWIDHRPAADRAENVVIVHAG